MQQKVILGLSFVALMTQCTMNETPNTGEPIAKEVAHEMTSTAIPATTSTTGCVIARIRGH